MGLYLPAKFKVSSKIVTSFRQGESNNFTFPTTSKWIPEKPTQIMVKYAYILS